MGIFNKGITIGKTIAGRVKDFPVFEKEPDKDAKKKSTCWIVCPDFRVKAPKFLSKEATDKYHNYTIQIFAGTAEERYAALNHMIRCGQEEIEAGDKRFWLHAVDYSFEHGGALFTAELKYIFRIK